MNGMTPYNWPSWAAAALRMVGKKPPNIYLIAEALAEKLVDEITVGEIDASSIGVVDLREKKG